MYNLLLLRLCKYFVDVVRFVVPLFIITFRVLVYVVIAGALVLILFCLF